MVQIIQVYQLDIISLLYNNSRRGLRSNDEKCIAYVSQIKWYQIKCILSKFFILQ